MSIEALIQAHTEALNTNTEAVKLLTLSLAGRTPAAEKPVKTAKADVVAAIKENLLGKEEPKSDPKDEDVSILGVPYETVRTLVLESAKAGKRDELATVFKKHGISNLKVLLDKEDDFSTVNDQEKLEAVYADLQALEA